MNNNNSSLEQHPSRFKLDSYIMESCSSDDRIMIEKHCSHCNECKEYLNSITNISTAITPVFPDFKSLDEAYAKKSSGKKQMAKKTIQFQPFFRPALAALLVFALIIPAYIIMHNNRSDILQVKGSPQWLLFTESKFANDALQEINVRASDTLQLFLQAAQPLYFTIMYQDDDGPLKIYSIENMILHNSPDGKPVPLPFSIVLDSLWSRQIIYCIASVSILSTDKLIYNIGNIEKQQENGTEIWIRKFTLNRK